MSIFVQAWVYANSEAQLADRLVLLAIADEADDDGRNAYPSQDRLAAKTRLARSTVRRCIENLERDGAIIVIRPETQGRGKFNRYVVCMGITPVEELGTTQEGADIEHLSGREKGQKGPPIAGPDPMTHRSIRKGAQSEPLSTTTLGRSLDAEPLWTLDDEGNAIYLGEGPKPSTTTRSWT